MQDLGLVQKSPHRVARDYSAGNWADGGLAPASANYAGIMARLAPTTAVQPGRLERSEALKFAYDYPSTDDSLISQMRHELSLGHVKLSHYIKAVQLWLSGSLHHCLADSDE